MSQVLLKNTEKQRGHPHCTTERIAYLTAIGQRQLALRARLALIPTLAVVYTSVRPPRRGVPADGRDGGGDARITERMIHFAHSADFLFAADRRSGMGCFEAELFSR